MSNENAFSVPCVPKFDGDYDHWSLIMENLLRSKEYWSVVESGIMETKENIVLNAAEQKLYDEAKLKDLKAKNYLFQAIDKSILKTITQKSTAKQLWNSMKSKYQGNERVQRAQLQRLRRVFETQEMKAGESISDYFGRVMSTANDMTNYNEDLSVGKIVEKILRTLTSDFNFVVCSIEESKDINKLTVDELQSSLLVHEPKVREKVVDEQVLKIEYDSPSTRGRGRGYSVRGATSSTRGRGRSGRYNRATVECFRCRKLGHYQAECPNVEKATNYVEFNEQEELLLMAHAELEATERRGIWFLDSGCSNHMTGDKNWFVEIDDAY
ncbi:unnamed protein product [Rhodiola kirilowii]